LPRPVSVAITGGIGAGKSEALKAFAEHGAAVVSSDEIVHQLLQGDEEVRSALRERWGEDIFTFTGDVDRPAVAALVFRDRAELEWLEALLHPRVVREYLAWREEQAAKPRPPSLTVTEVPLLYEVGGEARFDKVVAISADPSLRVERRGVGVDGRDERLLPDEEKLARADFAYVNDGTLTELDAFVAEVVHTLTA
jgi:dephospho-CoA kinase